MEESVSVFLWLVVIGPALDVPLTKKLKSSTYPGRRVVAYVLTMSILVALTLVLWPDYGETLFRSPFGEPLVATQAGAWLLILLMGGTTLQTWLHVRK